MMNANHRPEIAGIESSRLSSPQVGLAQLRTPKRRLTRRATPKPYDAFISYSHRGDLTFAPHIQRAIETIAKPWYRLRAIGCFRDETDLSATPALWDSILLELDRARFFVLLASPEAARSIWVGKEVERWLQINSSTRLVIALTAGEIVWDSEKADFDWSKTDALPRQLTGAFRDEPLWTDLRWARESSDLSRANLVFMGAIAKLAAPIRGLGVRELFDANRREHVRTLRIAWSAAGALAILLVLSLIFYGRAQRSSDTANRRLVELYQDQGRRELASGRPGRAATYLSAAYAQSASSGERRQNVVLPAMLSQALSGVEPQAAVFRHPRGVRVVAFSPSDRRLFTVDDQGAGRLWDPSTPALPASLAVGTLPTSAFFDSTGRFVATCSASGVRIWDAASLDLVRAFTPRMGGAAAAFSPDGSKLAVALAGEFPRVVDVATGETIAALKSQRSLVSTLAFDPNGHFLVAGSFDHTAVVYDTSTWQTLRVFADHQDAVSSVAVDAAGTRIATASSDGRALVYDVATGILESDFAAFGPPVIHDGDIMALKFLTAIGTMQLPTVHFTKNGRHLITANSSGVGVWDLNANDQITQITPRHGDIGALAFDDGDRLVATGEGDDTVRVWGLLHGELVTTFDAHTGPVQGLSFAKSGLELVSGANDGTARVWNLSQALAPRILSQIGPRCGRITMSPDHKAVTLTGWAGMPANVSVGRWTEAWRLDNLALLENCRDESEPPTGCISHHAGRTLTWGYRDPIVVVHDGDSIVTRLVSPNPRDSDVRDAALSSDGHGALTVGWDGVVRQWDVDRGTMVRTLKGPTASVAVFSPDGRWIVTAGENVQASVFAADTGAIAGTLGGQYRSATSLTISDDSSLVLVGFGAEHAVDAYRRLDGRLAYTLRVESADRNGTVEARISHSGAFIATAARESEIQLWSASDGARVTTFQVPDRVVWDFAFTPDDGQLVVTTEEGPVVLLPLPRETRPVQMVDAVMHDLGGYRIDHGSLVPNL